MAVTKIWPIKNSFAAPIIYVQNSEKTLNPNAGMSEESLQALEDVIEYAANEDKTEMKYYVSTINCNKRCARDEFAMVKKRFGKEGGIVAFHAYQSFAPGEVNPSEAHSIGVELARRLWGDRFQIVVATHVNTAAVHNHLVINSISFKDGKRFHGCRETTGMLREMSDRICQEHGLSVIKNPKGQRVNTYLYKMERAGMPTRYNVARKSIDEAIALSLTIEEFKAELRSRGYSYRFDPQRKYWTITPPCWKKPIRIHQLGENYTRESIERRIYENDPSVRTERVRQQYHRSNHYNLRRRIDRIMGRSGLEKLYLRYCYELGYLPKYQQNPTKLHILLKEDLLKCDQYSEQAKLLSKYHVNTDEDLSQLMVMLEDKMQSVSEERDEMRKVTRRNIPIAQIDAARDKVTELTAELRKELKVCSQVQERSDHVRENLEIIDRDRQREKAR
ncbi:MAG: relaxase/mobilization nuclease domain-containing protein [Oscillospiraceae bacterium]|nr:relaxase/mobilization nuclease domain-containing protein [Mogibacterium sp.]MBR0343049.1 relaxase/mobilization nuclease domain-containing protein [Oscillospiraceae bacterium]